MLTLQGVSYTHPDGNLLFDNISFTINKQNKIALIGNNGIGKSTLLKIMAGQLQAKTGMLNVITPPYYIPQHFGQYNDQTVAQALNVDRKLFALQQILAGDVTEQAMNDLADDWAIEERCRESLEYWQLQSLPLYTSMSELSGGQKTRVFLAGIMIHQPEITLLDEPSNHLDADGRRLLLDYIISARETIVVVSHDRTLLNLMDVVYELDKRGITIYGGNYDFYDAQKAIEQNALNEDLRSKEKALRKAKDIARETLERQQKLDARGRKKQEKSGVPTIMMNTLRNNAEKSTARIKDIHSEKLDAISEDIGQLRKELPDKDKMKLNFDDAGLHKGKILLTAKEVNFGYGDQMIWPQPLSFNVISGERIAIRGANGSGKTTLIKLMLGTIIPQTGSIQSANFRSVYIDQDYSLLNNHLTVFEQTQCFNNGAMEEHEVKSKLTHFLFTKENWNKPCSALSGGERMRLILCCLVLGNQAPDMIILDEPTNNLDIQNVEILTNAIRDYQGTVLVISHDEYFLKEVQADRAINLTGSY